MKQFTVTFEPWGRCVSVAEGETILEAAMRCDVPLEHACGGNCSCTTCHIQIQSGLEHLDAPSYDEEDKLDELPRRTEKSRLACQTEVISDLVVKVPGIISVLPR